MIVSIAHNKSTNDYTSKKAVTHLVNCAIDVYLRAKGYSHISELIIPASRVVIKPNFVMHENGNKELMVNPLDCFITQWRVIFAFLERLNEVEKLKIVIAECPMQWCDIDQIITTEIQERLNTIYKDGSVESNVGTFPAPWGARKL